MDDAHFVTLILLEKEEDEEHLLKKRLLQKRCETHVMFQTRTEEGYFNLLINAHLKEDEKKFRDFFR
ncbi:hypothetical protein NQ314_018100 [Rhamnusium bicolor]|uniref:Uncharacterized protein n=1 Tax=Rhamnusium bicolor TaxID=1586634 RepID=A0AAV8WS15_9CUCU|nr:hypothetical protein NQ314_018100 [Rhamnusium bicolor]